MNRQAKKLIKWTMIAVTGITLYILGAKAAYAQRGYDAFGGECLFLFMPVWWWMIETTIKDAAKDLKEMMQNESNIKTK